MFHWVMGEGALAFLLPTAPVKGVSLGDLVESLDGLILSGGVDMAPASYGESPLKPEWAGDQQRDEYEIQLVKEAMALDKPLLGICRGHQVLNVALGGTLFQDILTQNPTARVHRDWDIYDQNMHPVRLETQSTWVRFGTKDGIINSVHHQAVKDLAPVLSIEAWSQDDDIVEAARLKGREDPYVRGVQWHPEFQDPATRGFCAASRLFRAYFNQRAKGGAEGRASHARYSQSGDGRAFENACRPIPSRSKPKSRRRVQPYRRGGLSTLSSARA